MRLRDCRTALVIGFVLVVFLGQSVAIAQELPPPASDEWAEKTKEVSSLQKPPRPSNKWRISFDERAKSDGVISFRVWPGDAPPLQIDVPIVDNLSENKIAATVRDAIGTQLGSAYHVEVDDGEDVLVKARHGTKDFGIELIGNTVRDVDISMHRE